MPKARSSSTSSGRRICYLAVVLKNAPRFKAALAQVEPGTGEDASNLEEIAVAAVRFSEKLIRLGATVLADARLLGRHRRVMEQRGRGPREVFDLLAA
jgi:hypothetical protein